MRMSDLQYGLPLSPDIKSIIFRCNRKGLFRAAVLNSACPEEAFQYVFQ